MFYCLTKRLSIHFHTFVLNKWTYVTILSNVYVKTRLLYIYIYIYIYIYRKQVRERIKRKIKREIICEPFVFFIKTIKHEVRENKKKIR
jgi:hypothetical protein